MASQAGLLPVTSGIARPISMSAAQALITMPQISPAAIQCCPPPGPVAQAPAAHASSPQAALVSVHPAARNRKLTRAAGAMPR